MRISTPVLIAAAAMAVTANGVRATVLDQIGVTQLRSIKPALTGAGVILAQVEASLGGMDEFEVNPARLSATITGGSRNFIYGNYFNQMSNTFSSGSYSSHAQTVANNFYGNSGPVDGATTVYNFDSNDFADNYVFAGKAPPPGLAVVNQSFIYPYLTAGTNEGVDYYFDAYTDRFNTLFVSAIGNGQTTYTSPISYINAPSTSYNGIAVAAYGGVTVYGPTFDGRSKPDISAPASATSFAAPLVSGAAALLIQAGRQGIGSGAVAAATDPRTVKALLLNGAVKPTGWTHTASAPLDKRWGAGIVNVYNSYQTLAAGIKNPTQQSAAPLGQTGQIITSGTAESGSSGWAYRSITSSSTSNAVDNYLLNIGSGQTLTATLVWDRQLWQFNINHLDLYLYSSKGALIALSDSSIDNVQQIYATGLTAGLYDLKVVKAGGTSEVSPSEIYSLAYSAIGGTVPTTPAITPTPPPPTVTTTSNSWWGPSPSASAAPEPGTLVMLAVGSLLLLPRRRRAAT
ncbi:MAG: S8 family serine peptidase [Phycisphaerales bacterium]|nr:S8 family serine peptidase [Phycisphaerales bacterium]